MSAATRTVARRDSRTAARRLYADVTAAEREFARHMDELNIEHVPVAALVKVEPALTAAALQSIKAAIQCIEAARAESRVRS